MASYYRTIKGKRYDSGLLDAAEKSVSGKGDGRISIGDAKKILHTVKDSDLYSDIEKKTIKYIRDHYKFTPEADRYFRTEIRKWAAARGAGGGGAAKKAKQGKAKKPAKKTIPVKPVKKRTASTPPPVREDISEERAWESVPRAADAGPRPGDGGPGKASSGIKKWIGALCIILIAVLAYIFRSDIRSWFTGEKGVMKEAGGVKTDEKEQDMVTRVEDHKAVQDKPVTKETAVKTAGKEEQPKQKDAGTGGYTVVPGDSLIEISKREYGDYASWKRIYEANRGAIKDPALIYPGQKIVIPKGEGK